MTWPTITEWISLFVGILVGLVLFFPGLVAVVTIQNWIYNVRDDWHRRRFDKEMDAKMRRFQQASPSLPSPYGLLSDFDTEATLAEIHRQYEIERHMLAHPDCEADWTHEHDIAPDDNLPVIALTTEPGEDCDCPFCTEHADAPAPPNGCHLCYTIHDPLIGCPP
jgi:hypothetical protein